MVFSPGTIPGFGRRLVRDRRKEGFILELVVSADRPSSALSKVWLGLAGFGDFYFSWPILGTPHDRCR